MWLFFFFVFKTALYSCCWQEHQCEMKKWKTSVFQHSFSFVSWKCTMALHKQSCIPRYTAMAIMFKCFSHVSRMNAMLYKETEWHEIGGGHRDSAPLPLVGVQLALSLMPSSSTRTRRHYRIDSCNAESTRQDLGQSHSNRHSCASLAPEPHCLTGGENPALFSELLLRRFHSRPAEEEVRSLPVVVEPKTKLNKQT